MLMFGWSNGPQELPGTLPRVLLALGHRFTSPCRYRGASRTKPVLQLLALTDGYGGPSGFE